MNRNRGETPRTIERRTWPVNNRAVSYQPVDAAALGERIDFTLAVFAEGCDIQAGVDQTGVAGRFADLDPETVHFSRAVIAVDVSPIQTRNLRAPVNVLPITEQPYVGAVLDYRE